MSSSTPDVPTSAPATAGNAPVVTTAPNLAAPTTMPTLPGILVTSWLGNSIADRGKGLRVPTMLDAMTVFEDGTLALRSHYNEGGAAVTLIDGLTGQPKGHAAGPCAGGPLSPLSVPTLFHLASPEGLLWHTYDGQYADPSNGYAQYASHWTPANAPSFLTIATTAIADVNTTPVTQASESVQSASTTPITGVAAAKLFPEPFHYKPSCIDGRGGTLWVGDVTNYNDTTDPAKTGRLWIIDSQARTLRGWCPAAGITLVSGAPDGQSAWYSTGNTLVRVDIKGTPLAVVSISTPLYAICALPDGGCLTTSWAVNAVAHYNANGIRQSDLALRNSFLPTTIGNAAPNNLTIGGVEPGTIHAPVGVGVDTHGNLYIACADAMLPKMVRVDRYPSDGHGGWILNRGVRVCWGGTFGDCWRADPTYGGYFWNSVGVAVGDGVSSGYYGLIASTVDLGRNPTDPRRWFGCQGGAGRSTLAIRVLNGHRFLWTTVGTDWDVFRMPNLGGGWVLQPVAMFAERDPSIDRADYANAPTCLPHTGFMWNDTNGDGKMDANELVTRGYNDDGMGGGERAMVSVDNAGNVWVGVAHMRSDIPLGKVVKFTCRINALGNPTYAPADVQRYDLPQAALYTQIGFSGVSRDGDLWVLGRRGTDTSYSLALWPHWVSAGCPGANTEPAWVTADVADTTRFNANWAHWDRSVGAIDLAGDYLFLCEGINSSVRVYRRDNGQLVGRMTTDVAPNSTQDCPTAFDVTHRLGGEYLIITEGFLANCCPMYHWRPDTHR